MHREQAKEFLEGGNAWRQNGRSNHTKGSSLWKGQELRCLEEGVGSEDGGNDLPRSVDGAFAV